MNILSKRFISVSKLLLDTSYSLRCWIIVHRMHIAASVLVGNCLKIHFQGVPSPLYTRRHCSSISSHGIFFLAFRQLCSGSSSPKHPLSLPLSLSLPPSLSFTLLPSSLLSSRCTCDEALLPSDAKVGLASYCL